MNWQEILNRWEKSGLTQAKFCQTESIALSTFHYYRRKLAVKPAPVGFIKPELVRQDWLRLSIGESISLQINLQFSFKKIFSGENHVF